MTFKITKAQIAERDALVTDIRAKADALEAAITAYNDGIEKLATALSEAAEEYNGALADVQDFVSGVAEDGRAEFEEKSERWQEGEKGQYADAWLQQWESLELEDFEFDAPEPVEEIDPSSVSDPLADLPESAS